MDQESIISKLMSLGWSRQTLAVWQRAQYRCEYCGDKLLNSDGEYLYGSQIDHLAPNCDERDQFDNLALACKTCNFIKSNDDFADRDCVLSRDEIVARASKVILARREANRRRLQEVRDLIAQLDAPIKL